MRLILIMLMISLNMYPVSNEKTSELLIDLANTQQSEQINEEIDQDFAKLRQYVERRLLVMETGDQRLEQKMNSIINLRQEHWQEEYDWFLHREADVHWQINFYSRLEQQIQLFQQARADAKPKMDQPPQEALEYLAKGELKLNQGAPGAGPGFSRACPAEISSNEMIEGFDGQIESSSSGLMRPVTGPISAGTWAYPDGGLHLGMDIAAGMYSPLHAPANGVILYAANPVGDGGGYLGNWVGWPYGGGNTIAMICQSGGQLYGVTFCHLSSRIMVRAGQQVEQGDILAYTGNTGNSTGPHTHIELFAIHTSFQEAVSYFQQGADFSFGTGWSTPAACSAIACQLRPELYF
ncbi:MAG: M23 family metallopeptidase [Erysipelotrichaceae bacterium]|nr:M23 family metallopeptidase [Erysipelotrichaceae bacterium]